MRSLKIVSLDRPDPKLYFGPEDAGYLDWDNLLWRFAAEKSYWLTTSDTEGKPHAMPVWGIWLDAGFWFSTYPHSKKAKNLKANPQANVHLGDTEALLVLECSAHEVTETAAQQQFVDEYNPKYNWQFTPADVAGGLFTLTPHTAFAWAAGEGEKFHNTATRWRFEVESG